MPGSAEHSARDLLTRSRRGDEVAAALLWAILGPGLIRYAVAITHDLHTAEDVVQQVFVEAITLPREQDQQIREPRAWFAIAVRRRAANALRAKSRRRQAELQAPKQQTPGVAPDLPESIQRLDRRHQEVLILRHALSLSFPQMALTLGIAPSTASDRYAAAVAALRDMVNPSEILRA